MKKILIVDDDRTLSELLAVRLQVQGYDVIRAFDGVEALVKARDTLPDLIMLDMVMPVMDGYTLVQEIRWVPELRSIPLFVVSGQAKARKLFGPGLVQQFVSKPFDTNELLCKIENTIKPNLN